MRIAILLFASLRDAAGTARMEVEAPGQATPRQLAELAAERHEKLRPHLQSLAFAVDGEFVAADAVLHNVRELALLPPVSGG